MIDELLSIISYYGADKQLKYFQTEVFELAEAIISYECAVDSNHIHNCKCPICYDLESFKNHIAEEIADVSVMLAQFQYYFRIKTEDVGAIMESKINRQLERIEQEKK